jgi:hypothetical protein
MHVVFVAGTGGNELLAGARTLDRPAPKNANKGDVALFYVGGAGARAIYGIGLTAEKAHVGTPAGHWTESKRGYFAKYTKVKLLSTPLHRDAIRVAFPKWKRWDKLFGVRVHTVPLQYRRRLAKLITAETRDARLLLAPWLGGSEKAPNFINAELLELRYEGSQISREHVTYERSRTNRTLAIAASRPLYTCIVCDFNFEAAFGLAGRGFIEVHHTKPVSHSARVPKAGDLAVLCSNCHSIAHWRQGSQPLSVSQLCDLWRKGSIHWTRRSR